MEKLKNKTLWGVIFTLVAINCLTIAYFLSSSQPHNEDKAVFNQDIIEDEIVATIGDDTISRQEWLIELENQYGKETLKNMVDHAVIENLAKKYKIEIPSNEIDIELQMLKATYSEKLEDEAYLREQLRVSLLRAELLTRDVSVADLEVKSFYEENKELYDIKTSYQLAHILVNSKEEAVQVVEELKSGSNFATLAREKSLDEFTSSNGGELGLVTENSDYIPNQYFNIAKSLKENEWSDPVQTENGYAVIFLHNVMEGISFSYEDVKNQIRRQIALEQIGESLSVEHFWKEANVTWFYGNQQQ